jgi:molybdopterin molybdotransferase
VFVVFELLVKPFLYKLMGHDYEPQHVLAELGQGIKRKHAERMEWIPVVTEEDGTVRLVAYHGSAHINALCRANGLIAVDIGVGEIQRGTLVRVRLL